MDATLTAGLIAGATALAVTVVSAFGSNRDVERIRKQQEIIAALDSGSPQAEQMQASMEALIKRHHHRTTSPHLLYVDVVLIGAALLFVYGSVQTVHNLMQSDNVWVRLVAIAPLLLASGAWAWVIYRIGRIVSR